MDSEGKPITEHSNQDVAIGLPYDETELRMEVFLPLTAR